MPRKSPSMRQRAKAQGAAVLLTPELSLCGYPPEDLLLRDGFYHACDVALGDLAQHAQGIILIVGHPHKVGKSCYNAASILRDGKIVATYHKHALPNHSVFDEERYFAHGKEPCLIEMDGIKFGINICADVWHEHAAIRAKEAGAEVLLVLNASPYHFNKQSTRYETIRDRIGDTGLAVVYANLVGGQDELVFDGASFVMDNEGELTHQFPAFEEVLGFVEFRDGKLVPGVCESVVKDEASIYHALCLGVRDYIRKNNFPGVLLGLSGGIDSALTLAVAVDALGADKVRAVMMPSPYTAQISKDDSREMVKLLGVRYEELDILPTFDALQETLSPVVQGAAHRYHRRKFAGAHPRHTADGTVQQDRLAGADHRQQVGDDRRLCHVVRRHGGRFCGAQGCEQDLGVPPVEISQHTGTSHTRTHHYAAAQRRIETGPDRSGQPAALRRAGCDHGLLC